MIRANVRTSVPSIELMRLLPIVLVLVIDLRPSLLGPTEHEHEGEEEEEESQRTPAAES